MKVKMITIGEFQIGCFYEKDKQTYQEFNGEKVVKHSIIYAQTGTNKVVLLLDNKDQILDMDDIPTDDAFEICGHSFVAFLKTTSLVAFLFSKDLLENLATLQFFENGAIRQLEIYTDDFHLTATFPFEQSVCFQEIDEEDYLLLYMNANPILNIETKQISLFQASATILKIENA